MPKQESHRRPILFDLEKRTRTILETAFDAFLEVDGNGVITDWNSKAEAAFGWSRKEAIGRHAKMLVPMRHCEAFVSEFGAIIQAGENFELEKPTRIRCVHRDGREFSGELILYPSHQSGAYRLSAYLRDLTERRRLEAALREIEDHRTILNFVEDGYVEHDLRGNILFVNDAYCRLFGRTREEVLDTSYKKTIQGSVSVDIPGLYNNVYRTGEPIKAFTYEFSPGRFAEITVSLKRGSKGEPTGFVTVSRNCTERKLQEQELARARDAAEAANKAKSEFLANISHEIRTPMNGVIGMTELALGTELTAEQKDYLTTVHESAESLLAIINDILDFSKIEAGKLTLDPLPFDLAECVASATRSLSVSARHKGLALESHVDPAAPKFMIGDSSRLRQVLVNLIGNAIKFTGQGGVTVNVEVKEIVEKRAELHFSVRDTGIGIEPEKQARIFEAFEQADTSLTRRYGGTGLGLAISKRIVEAMDGHFWVESQLGTGSTFHFNASLLIAPQTPAPDVQDRPAKRRAPVRVRSHKPVRILVAEDNAVNQKLAAAVLNKMGHEVTVVSTGADAVARWAEDDFALILMDVQMPDMDGFEATRRIRAQEKATGGHIPVIAMTARAMQGDRERCLAAGMDEYITKPVDTKRLAQTIAQFALPALAVRKTSIQRISRASKVQTRGRRLTIQD